jgi:signal transduction histidine kinase
MLGNIENATTRAADLTSKLLGFARKGKYQEQLLDVTAIANDAATLFKIGLKEIDFRLLVEPGAFIILGDATQLQQVFLNILINAKDALADSKSQTRKITLRIDRATDELPAWNQRPEGITDPSKYVAIRIKDTGAGMDEETLAHVFDPFYTTKEHKGTGLGLAMAYGCITHHHGWITIASQQGKGTEVTIILPLAK